jgi:putative sigma-54 modulation protein
MNKQEEKSMNIKIQTVHFDADKRLLDFTQKKVEKLMKFYDGIVSAEIIFRLDKNQNEENKIAEIKLEIPGNDLFAKRQCKSFENAVDQVSDALKKQITKHKEKQRGV